MLAAINDTPCDQLFTPSQPRAKLGCAVNSADFKETNTLWERNGCTVNSADFIEIIYGSALDVQVNSADFG